MQAADETVYVSTAKELLSSFNPNANRSHAIRWKNVNCFEVRRDVAIMNPYSASNILT